MKHLKILEHIEISDYRKWHNIKNDTFDKDMEKYFKEFQDHDRNYYRIYFDFKPNIDEWNYDIPREIIEYLYWFDYIIVDKIKGLCKNYKNNVVYKIGKVLASKKRDDLLKIYADSRTNILKDMGDLSIVISRHTYDIAGQSTNRRWTTCHDIKDAGWDGKYLYDMKNEMLNGVLVAYVIKKNDRNIKNPLARTLIYRDVKYLKSKKSQYGIPIPGFLSKITNFCNKYNNYVDKNNLLKLNSYIIKK